MKPKTMILMVVAVACGLAASYMTSKLLAERKAQPTEERVPILVAKTKVPKYTLLKDPEKFFDRKERLREDLPAGGYFGDFKEIQGKKVNREIKADVHIAPEDVQDHMNNTLPIPDGYGSIAIKVTAASAVSYFVAPGDKVDIVLTQRGENASAATIGRDVLVLAVADKIVRQEEGGQPTGVIPAQTVAIAVKPKEGMLIKLAEGEGELSLVLRKENDKSDWNASGIVTRDDLKSIANRGGSFVTTPKPEEEPKTVETPKTLPFGLPMEALKKPEEPEEKVEPIKPKWEVVVEYGNAPSLKIPYYEKPDGSLTRDLIEPPAPKAPEKKPEKTDSSEKKPESPEKKPESPEKKSEKK
jgi:Flp pilus assembly protein CpaB